MLQEESILRLLSKTIIRYKGILQGLHTASPGTTTTTTTTQNQQQTTETKLAASILNKKIKAHNYNVKNEACKNDIVLSKLQVLGKDPFFKQ